MTLITVCFGEQVPLGSIAKSRCHSSLQNGDTSNGTAEGRDERKQYAHIRRNKESTLRRRGSMFQLDHESRDLGRVVDKWSRAVFPLAFLCFNVGYWVYYTQSAESRSIEWRDTRNTFLWNNASHCKVVGHADLRVNWGWTARKSS